MQDGDDDEELEREGKKRKKNVRFLQEDEIEGQVAGSKGGGHVSADFSVPNGKGGPNAILREKQKEQESSSESDADDEERAYVGDGD